MPTISVFYGIAITMRYREHNPPHFHALYQNYDAAFDLDGNLIAGEMLLRQRKLIVAWAEIHRCELEENWALSMRKERLFRIPSLW